MKMSTEDNIDKRELIEVLSKSFNLYIFDKFNC